MSMKRREKCSLSDLVLEIDKPKSKEGSINQFYICKTKFVNFKLLFLFFQIILCAVEKIAEKTKTVLNLIDYFFKV